MTIDRLTDWFLLKKTEVPLLSRFGYKGTAPGRFLTPDGMAMSKDGEYIVVAD